MKCLTRYLSVLCCLVLFFGCFSVVANAEIQENYHVYMSASMVGNSMGAGTVYPFDGKQQVFSWNGNLTGDWVNNTAYLSLTFATSNKVPFITKGKTGTIRIDNIYWSIPLHDYANFSLDSVSFIDVAGNYHYMTGDMRLSKKDNLTFDVQLDFEGEAPADIYKINFAICAEYSINYAPGDDYYTIFGEPNDTTIPGYQMTLDIDTKEVGLLKSIIAWLGEIGGHLSSMLSSIRDLPSKIWGFIENGLKNLFVPDEQYIVDYKSRWEELLADKLGAVYEVVQITFNSWDRIQDSDTTNTITLPTTTINLPNNNSFSFGGQSVPVVPSGFEFLADVIKTLTGGLCTILFINGLRKRYDEIMGVEQ